MTENTLNIHIVIAETQVYVKFVSHPTVKDTKML